MAGPRRFTKPGRSQKWSSSYVSAMPNNTKRILVGSSDTSSNNSDYLTIDIDPLEPPERPATGQSNRHPSRRKSGRKRPDSSHMELLRWKQKMELNNDSAKIVSVIGSGDYGRAMAGKLGQSGYTVLLGARDPNNPQTRLLVAEKDGVHLVSQTLAASADIVLIAVGSDHYRKLPLKQLQNKIVVDVANWTIPRPAEEPSIAEGLQDVLPNSKIVKAFNVLSAYALENNVVQGGKQVPVASNDPEARARILSLAKELGYTPVDFGDLRRAREIEDIPLQLLPQWRNPVIFVLALWGFQYLLLVFKYQICCLISGQNVETHHLLANLGLLNFNRSTAITSLWTLALCYLPGVIAAYIQLWRGTKYERFPQWLDTWLRARKQLGIIMLFLATAHTILGAAVWSPRYDSLLFESPEIISIAVQSNESDDTFSEIELNEGSMTWQGELFITAGTISMMVTYILGISSLPSVGSSLSWREFTFIQSKLGWLALVAATAHDALLGFGLKIEHYQDCYIASGAQYALHVPLITIILKIPLILPCVENHLLDIRKGHDRSKKKQQNEKLIVPA